MAQKRTDITTEVLETDYAARACEVCGRVFQPPYGNPQQRYCSQVCVPRFGVHYKTHCKHGHPLDGDNLSPRYGKTPPRCRECQRERQRIYKQKRRAKAKVKEEQAYGGKI